MSEGGNGSKYAVNYKGKLAAASVVYAGMGLNFRDPKEVFDASKYAGITFFAKRAAGATGKVFVKLPDVNTDPDGAVCSACYNDFEVELTIGDRVEALCPAVSRSEAGGNLGITAQAPHRPEQAVRDSLGK